MHRRSVSAVVAMAIGLSGIGCAGYTKTVSVEERVQPAAAVEPSRADATVTRTTTTVRSQAEPTGLLSATVRFVGNMLALPFRLIGGLLRLLF